MAEKQLAKRQEAMALTDRAQEDYRQHAIQQGLTALGQIFQGGDYGTGRVDPLDLVSGQTYYTPTGEAFTVPAFKVGAVVENPLGGDNFRATRNVTGVRLGDVSTGIDASLSPIFNYHQWMQAAKMPLLFSRKASTGGFSDPFYNRRRDAYLEYAMPQLQEQYGDAQAQLAFALSRAGTGSSSVANRRFSTLGRDYGLRQQEIADTAQDYANQARADVATARSNAENLLTSTGNADLAVRQALETATRLQQSAPAFSPLGAVFQNASAGLAGFMEGARFNDLERRVDQAYPGLAPSTSGGAGRVVR